MSSPRITRRRLGLAAGSALLAPTWPAFGATPKDTLVLAMAIDDVISLDPAESFEISGGEFMGNAYDRLLRFDIADPSKLVGDLASRWSVSGDGRLFSFELKPGLRFASGNPISADDVAYSWQRAVQLDLTPAFILNQFGLSKANVQQRVRATGPLTLTLQTDQAYAPSLVFNCLTANVAAVVDAKLLRSQETAGDFGHAWLKTHYAGSGALKIRDWRANEIVVLERNQHYHGPQALVQRVIYRHIKESATQRLLLEKGDIDIARNLSPQDLDALAGRPDIRSTAQPKGTLYYISLNQKHPILAKPQVREAFKWLIDYDAIGATLIKHIGVVHQNFLPLGLLGASTARPYRLDVPRAKALLAQAGVPDGFKVTIDMRSVQPTQGLTEAVQQSLARAGIQLSILPGDGKQTLTKYRARTHELYIGNWSADYWDPHTNADTFASNPDNADDAKTKPLAWRNAWAIPALTQQTAAAALERDTARRVRLYEQLQAEFRKSSPFVMLYQETEVAAFRANVSGLRLGPTSDTNFMSVVSKA
jgi:peptide/nickel transport system substrate-binding protein